MKKLFALLLAVIMILSFAACSKSDQESSNKEKAPTANDTTNDITEQHDDTAALDIGSLNWVNGELDCYGYDECYLSFKYPDVFKTGTENSSGLQYRGYYYNPKNSDATANESPYGIYIYFNQGAYGAKRETLEADIEGGFKERELGGRTVLFGEVGKDENAGAYTFSYYTAYSDDEYARIWFIVTDAEEDGEFRKTFEQSLNFNK